VKIGFFYSVLNISVTVYNIFKIFLKQKMAISQVFLAYFPKIKVGLSNHQSVCLSVYVYVCVYVCLSVCVPSNNFWADL
jgi:hypothetical protein